MLRKVKKFTSLFLVAALVLVFFIPASADASIIGGNTGGGVIPPEDSVVHTYLGSQITDELWDTLEEIGVELNADTILQARPMNETNDSLVLTITNQEESLITTDVFMAFDNNDATDIVAIDEYGTLELVGRGFDVPATQAILRVIVSYNCYYDEDGTPYCQPQNMQAAVVNSAYNVTSMTLSYITKGYEYTYPGFLCLGDLDDDEGYYTHRIHLTKLSPVRNMYYFASNPYMSTQVIKTVNGGNPLTIEPMGIDYRIYIDGVLEYDDTVTFSVPHATVL